MTKILIDRAVVEQSLEALDGLSEDAVCQSSHHAKKDRHTSLDVCPVFLRLRAAITALKAALAEPTTEDSSEVEPVQEPVAWMVYTEGGTSAYVTDNPNDLVGAYRALPLYTAPPPLTDEKLDELAMDKDGLPNSHIEFARAIERAHGIT